MNVSITRNVCMNVSTSAHINICTYAFMYECMYVCKNVRTNVCLYV